MLTDEHKLVRRTKPKKKRRERESYCFQTQKKEKAMREYIEQKQMPIVSNKKKNEEETLLLYISMNAQLD